MSDTPATPATIDRAALERILQRASELQVGERDIADALTPAEVVSLASEVGIPARYVQQALLEERTRVEVDTSAGVLGALAGPAVVSAQRVVAGDANAAERTLLRWMEDNEILAIQRQQPGRVTWEPLRGFSAALKRGSRALNVDRAEVMLARTETVSATIVPLEGGYLLVSTTADVRPARRSALRGALASLLLGGLAVFALMAMHAVWPIPLTPIPVALVIAWGALRRHRPLTERVALGLERALDQVERGAVKPAHAIPGRTAGVVGIIAEEIRKALSP